MTPGAFDRGIGAGRVICLVTIVALAGACSSNPDRLMYDEVSPAVYESYDCDELAGEIVYIGYRVRDLYEWLSAERKRDTWLASFSWFYGVTALFIHGDGPEVAQYKRLRGEFEAVRLQALTQQCGLEADTPEAIIENAKTRLLLRNASPPQTE